MINPISKLLSTNNYNKQNKRTKKKDDSEKGRIIMYDNWELSEIIKAINVAKTGGKEFISFDMSKDTWTNEKYIIENLKNMGIDAEHKGESIVVNLKNFSMII